MVDIAKKRKPGGPREVGPQDEPMLIETKLSPPQVSSRLLPIPRLEQTFDAAFSRRLSCLIAPAGYGKTSTLIKQRDFVESKGVRTSWLNLDVEDNDPIRFVHYLAVALNRRMPSVGSYALAQLRPGATPAVEAILLSICNDLAQIDHTLALFLDDYHVINHDAVHEAMRWLIARSPRNLKFFIASRAELPFGLSKLHLAEDIHEIRAEQLSLDSTETAMFVTAVSGRTLTTAQTAALHQRTEGWMVGLQLASLALKRSEDVNEFIDAFSGTDRDVTAYLGEIVLRQLPMKQRGFITQTALFDRFSVEFCRDVLNTDDAVELVEWIETRHLFLIPLDRQRKWYRYHHLFADYLRERFTLFQPERAKEIYRAASDWFERQRLPGEAIQYAFIGNDTVRAADLIAGYAYELVQLRGEHATLLNWVTVLPPLYLAQRPAIQLPYIWSLMLTHRYHEAEAAFGTLERFIAERQAAPMSREKAARFDLVRQKYGMMRSAHYAVTDRVPLAAEWGVKWLAQWERIGDPMDVATVNNVCGYHALLSLDYELADQHFTISHALHERAGSFYGVAWSVMLQAITALARGNTRQADRILGRGYTAISDRLGPYSNGGALIALVRSAVFYEQNRIDEAEQLLEHAFAFVENHGGIETSAAGYLTKANILWLRGHPDEADACLVQGIVVAERKSLHRLALILGAERIHLLLKSGALDQATSLAQAVKRNDSLQSMRHAPASVMRIRIADVRLHLATNQLERAQLLIGDLLTQARRAACNTLVVRLLCLKAVLLARRERRDEAHRVLDEALTIGAIGGQCRVFADEGPLIGELLREIWDHRVTNATSRANDTPQEYLQHILETCSTLPPQHVPPATIGNAVDPETFSEREIQILKLADNGLANRELAAQLFLSEATVKWHLHNIYNKLGVNNRTKAIACARKMALI